MFTMALRKTILQVLDILLALVDQVQDDAVGVSLNQEFSWLFYRLSQKVPFNAPSMLLSIVQSSEPIEVDHQLDVFWHDRLYEIIKIFFSLSALSHGR